MISLLTPTRNRPRNLRRLVDSVKATATNMPEIMCYVDEDDHSYVESGFPEVTFHRAPRIIMSDMWNVLSKRTEADICMLTGDDMVFRTNGWDVEVEAAFAACPDKILLVFCQDKSKYGGQFATHYFVHRRWIDAIGFTGSGFSADFCDKWMNDVADAIGRKQFLPNPVIEHLHWVWKKAKKDQTYLDNLARRERDNTPKLYADRWAERAQDIEKLLAIMDPGWQLPKARRAPVFTA